MRLRRFIPTIRHSSTVQKTGNSHSESGSLFVFRGLSDDPRSGLAEALGVLQLNVCAKHFMEHFIGFWLRILCICHGLFDADDLMALRALAEAMTGAIHFVPWTKPTNVGQFWLFHAPSFPHARRFGYPVDIQTDPLPRTATYSRLRSASVQPL